MNINFIGLGRLGKALGRLFAVSQVGQIQALHSLTYANVVEFVQEIGVGKAYEHMLDMPHAELTILATPDDHIEAIARALAHHALIRPGDIVMHCSGVLSSDILAPLRDKGACIASVHPLKSFTALTTVENCFGTYCAIEGDVKATQRLDVVFKALGCIPFSIEPEKKTLYHCGAVFASNYLVTLYHEATLCLEQAGVNHVMAKDLTLSLMQGTLNNLKQQEPRDALTGPLARGDIQTIDAHLNALNASQSLYKSLAKATLTLTGHSEETLQALNLLLKCSD